MKANCKKLKYWKKEEKASSKEYGKYGFKRLSKDEARHSRFFERKIKEECK